MTQIAPVTTRMAEILVLLAPFSVPAMTYARLGQHGVPFENRFIIWLAVTHATFGGVRIARDTSDFLALFVILGITHGGIVEYPPSRKWLVESRIAALFLVLGCSFLTLAAFTYFMGRGPHERWILTLALVPLLLAERSLHPRFWRPTPGLGIRSQLVGGLIAIVTAVSIEEYIRWTFQHANLEPSWNRPEWLFSCLVFVALLAFAFPSRRVVPYVGALIPTWFALACRRRLADPAQMALLDLVPLIVVILLWDQGCALWEQRQGLLTQLRRRFMATEH